MRRGLALLIVIAAGAPRARAWEADTTHAGLTEQAALASKVHDALTGRLGRDLGWYHPLAVSPAGAPALYAKLKLLPPSSGLVPDARGEQTALSWLLAGAVIEDMPSSRGANHFYDPVHKRGLSSSGHLQVKLMFRGAAAPRGKAAPDWVMAQENDLSIPRFWRELELSQTAATPAERDEHLAFALLCAGAVLHVLEDMASPPRVHDDWDEFLQELGGGNGDRGSRFERLAALIYGRLGVPAIDPAVERSRVLDYFTAADGKGLADVVAARPYRSRALDDEESARAIADLLPTAGGYATGLLDFLFRGTLQVDMSGDIVVTSKVDLGAGTVRILIEDAKGNRTEAFSGQVTATKAGAPLASLPVDGTPAKVIVMFHGLDAAGDELVAVGRK